MPIPQNKKDLQDVLRQNYKKLRAELVNIPTNLSRKETVEGRISVADIIAYQIGWGKLLLNWYAEGKKGHIPAMPAKGYKWNQLGDLAKKFHSDYRHKSLEELLPIFDSVVEKVIEIVDNETNENLYKLGIYEWTGDKWPLGRWINVNTSSPYKSASAKIRKWKREERDRNKLLTFKEYES